MSEVLKTIGHYTITEQDIDAFISSLPKEQQMYRSIPQFREQVLGRLEEITLFALLAEENKIDETEEYQAALNDAKRDIGSQLAMRDLLKDVTVSDEEVKDFFEKHQGHYGEGPSADAKHILVDDEAKALEIKAEIESGAKTFAEAAQEYSSCPSGKQGGSLGKFGRGQMVKEFDEVAFTGELKTLLGPVKTQFGYHLIWIDARTEGGTPDFEAVKDKVKRDAMAAKQEEIYSAKLAELRTKY